MPEVEVKLPPLGDDAPDEATFSFFYVEEGSTIKEGDDFCEMFTDKATFNVPAPYTGTVKKLCVNEGDLIAVGQLLAIMDLG